MKLKTVMSNSINATRVFVSALPTSDIAKGITVIGVAIVTACVANKALDKIKSYESSEEGTTIIFNN